ncbi:hypothetical protein L6164_033450 [Bauhinia variegata]|uniref:Uncharacterized protein n=1 Tax=Bauhinia variegata TaxID=167791 RepID=A0ACB9KRV3_BAUVA|nr:hypothetical protein L6164_033450 [Bauhinia variegata]
MGTPPNRGFYKLNIDGSSLGNPGRGSIGGVIRDVAGTWVTGFMEFIGLASNILAELEVLKRGLILVCQELTAPVQRKCRKCKK